MMRTIVYILVTAFIVVALSNFLPGTQIRGFQTGIWVAVVLGLMNIFVKPLLILFTLPVTVFTFGLFLLVINAFLIIICSRLIDGFYVDGFWWALLFSLLLSFCQSVLFAALEKFNRPRTR